MNAAGISDTTEATQLAVKVAAEALAARGIATEATLAQVRDAIKAQLDLASSVWTDNSGAYYVRRDLVNQGTGTVTVAFTDATGAAATPGAGLRPLADADRDVTQTVFEATAGGTGYALGDVLARLLIVDAQPTTPTVAALWVNITTGSVISAPSAGTTELADEAVGVRQLGSWTVAVSSLPLPPGAATEATLGAVSAKLAALATVPPSQDASAPPVRLVGQGVYNAGFGLVGASVLDAFFVQTPKVGSGVSYNQAAGALNIVAGTTANAEFLARSAAAFQGAHRLRFTTVLSQRIVNNNFAVMVADLLGENLAYTIVSATQVDVNLPAHGFTAQNVGQSVHLGGITGAAGIPGRYAIASITDANTVRFTVASWPASGSGTLTLFGRNCVRTLFNGTTVTNAAVDAQRNGWFSGDTTATINTTASPGTQLQVELTGREVYWHDKLRASSTTPTVATRASRDENIPDCNLPLYVFVWSFNGSTAPASSTTWTLGHLAIEDFAAVPMYLQGVRPNGAANPLPVAFPAAQSVSISGNPAVAGVAAEDAAASGNPVMVAGVVRTAVAPTTLVAGDVARLSLSSGGQLITKPYAPGQVEFSASLALTTTTAAAIAAAAAAGIRNHLTSFWAINTGASAVDLILLDGATERTRYTLPVNVPTPVFLPTGIVTTAATALNANLSAAGTVRLNAHGYAAA